MAWQTNLAVFDHVLFANLRGLRPINRAFFDNSLISFVLTYLLFVPLTWIGIKSSQYKNRGSLDQLLFIILCFSLLLSFSVLLRAGGDVNYFFESIFISLYFCAKGAQRWLLPRLKPPRIGAVTVLSAQLLLISAIYLVKANYATKAAFLPFELAAQKLRERLDPYVLFWGHHGASLSIHLRDLGLHGPDVTNTSEIAKNAHPRMRKILTELVHDVKDGTVKGVVLAHEKCDKRPHFKPDLPLDNKIFEKFKYRELIFPWLCVFYEEHSRVVGQS